LTFENWEFFLFHFLISKESVYFVLYFYSSYMLKQDKIKIKSVSINRFKLLNINQLIVKS